MKMTKVTRVSAPGKILFAGGYLVLESPNIGYVVAADKRFYSTVESQDSDDDGDDGVKTIVVHSPQFHSKWTYSYEYMGDRCSLLADPNNASTNPFVEKTLRVVLAFLNGKAKISSMNITIQADNDFYSIIPHLKGQPRTPHNIQSLGKFLNCPQDPETGKAIVNKTGLGSSAALTTSLVGALYKHHIPRQNDQSSPGKEMLNTIHNLAQICHCHAQGKVGSGFDVSAAMHGSHLYRRFPKCTLPDLLQELGSSADQVSAATSDVLEAVATTQWVDEESPNPMMTPLPIPAGLQVMLADVCGGSESPSMARKVLAWKQAERIKRVNAASETGNAAPTSGDSTIFLWDALKETNLQIAKLMQELAKEDIGTETLSRLHIAKWTTELECPTKATELLINLHECFKTTRKHLKAMGDAAEVPIEPAQQSELCDATMELPGVIATLVPGAGGYDAVACLYIDTPNTRTAIGELWANWKKDDQTVVCPLAVQATDQGIQFN